MSLDRVSHAYTVSLPNLLKQTRGRLTHFLLVSLQVVTAILESGKNMAKEEKKAEKCPLLYEWHKKQYVGAAHGLAGIYCMLMQVS